MAKNKFEVNNPRGNCTINQAETINNYESGFQKLLDLCNTIPDRRDRIVLLNLIQEMNNNVGKPSFREKYNAFLQQAANYMTIFSPFISFLGK